MELGNLEHILSYCPKALGEKWYCWNHNQVFKALVDSICTAIQSSKSQAAPMGLLVVVDLYREGRAMVCYLNTGRGLITPGWVAQARVTLNTLRPWVHH